VFCQRRGKVRHFPLGLLPYPIVSSREKVVVDIISLEVRYNGIRALFTFVTFWTLSLQQVQALGAYFLLRTYNLFLD